MTTPDAQREAEIRATWLNVPVNGPGTHTQFLLRLLDEARAQLAERDRRIAELEQDRLACAIPPAGERKEGI